MRKQLFLFACLFWLGIGLSYAQSISISGRVLDAGDGQPVIGATVVVVQTGQGTITNVDGNFTITVPNAGAMLRFSFMGYETVDVPAQNGMTVRMRPDVGVLDEVIITGFGTGRTGATLVSNVTRVGPETLQNRPVANVLDALQGQVAGLAVITSSGEPSAMTAIRLHGAGSLSASTAPLFVLDGMPIEPTTLRALNPEDFESVTILRDASATAIYGSRAANGVVFITTRRGAVAEHGVVRVSGMMGFSELSNRRLFDGMMSSDEFLDFRVERGVSTQAWADGIRANPIFQDANGDLVTTRWDRVFFKDRAPTNSLNASITGGGGRTNYFISTGRFMQDGMAFRSRYERLTFRSNVNSHVNNWLRVGVNASVMHDDFQSNPNFGGLFTWGGLAFLNLPFLPAYNHDGDRFDVIPQSGNMPHPAYMAEHVTSPTQNIFLASTGFVELTPIEGLTIRTQASFDGMFQNWFARTLPSYSLVNPVNRGTLSREQVTRSTITSTTTAEYRFSLEDIHNFAVLAGHEYITHRWEFWGASAMGFTDDRLLLLPAGPLNRSVSGNSREHVFLSFFGRAEYNLRETYFLDVSFRNDASSRFGPENRNAQFWSVGTMWHLHRENWAQESDFDWLNEFTVRLSVGTAGNSDFTPGNLWNREYGHLALTGVGAPYNGETSWVITSPGNIYLTWEQQTLYTLNFRLGVLNNRLRTSIDFYNRITSAMLLDVPHPWSTGFNTVTNNIGRLGNRGISFRIDGDVWMANRGRSFFSPYVVFNYNQERVLELFDERDHWMPTNAIAWVVGQPRVHVTPMWAGVNVETGLPQWYVPVGGDESITGSTHMDPNDITNTFNEVALRQNTGRQINAPINGGFGFNAGHLGFTLQTDFAFSVGAWAVVNDRFFTENTQHGFNLHRSVQDFWREPGDVAAFPRVGQQLTHFDSRLVCNRSFLRLKNVTLGYSIPREWLQRTNFFSDARLFVSGRNLLTFTNFTGQDPEFDGSVMQGMFPNTRQFTMGFDVSF